VELPSGDETCSPNNLRNPKNSVCQTDVVHVDNARDAGDSSDPEDGRGKHLNRTCKESDFTESSTKPDPGLRLWIIDLVIRMPVEAVSALCIQSMHRIAEAHLLLARKLKR
jgi:hypothetical protein